MAMMLQAATIAVWVAIEGVPGITGHCRQNRWRGQAHLAIPASENGGITGEAPILAPPHCRRSRRRTAGPDQELSATTATAAARPTTTAVPRHPARAQP